jgi:hypothetical protein
MKATIVTDTITVLLAEGFKLGKLGAKKPKPLVIPTILDISATTKKEPLTPEEKENLAKSLPPRNPAYVRPQRAGDFWDESRVKEAINRDDQFVIEVMKYLYDRHADVDDKFKFLDFNKDFMSSVGRQASFKGSFSIKQIAAVRKSLMRVYWKWFQGVSSSIHFKLYKRW